jgi:hypothetical protein
VEPEDSPDNFFDQVLWPVSTASVQQFMTRNDGLEARIGRQEIIGQENDRIYQAVCHRRIDTRREAKLGIHADFGQHLIENCGRRVLTCDRRGRQSESPQSYEPERKEYEPQGNSANKNDADPFGDDWHARKVPVCGSGCWCCGTHGKGA